MHRKVRKRVALLFGLVWAVASPLPAFEPESVPAALNSYEDSEALLGKPRFPTPTSDVPDSAPEEPATADVQFASEAVPSNTGATSAAPAVKCDAKKCQALEKSVAGAYKNLFYDNDFSYLCDPCYGDHWLGESFKQNCLGECAVWDIGGQYRLRQQSEENFRGIGLTGADDDFLLHRTRLYGNLEYSDHLRFYAEMIDAESNYEDFAPRGIEVNRTDMLNLFVDYKLFEGGEGDTWTRIGRQELQYGEQRLVSPLDWANTRRTFDGYQGYYRGPDWNCDAFYTRPVDVAAYSFDNPSYDREFAGVYATYKGREKETVDLYYLLYNNQLTPFHYNTFGGRYMNTAGPLLIDVEGAYQPGAFQGNDHHAGFFVTGLGHQWKDVCWQPTLWVYYDWASGDDIIGNGFDHLFPLAHKYLGYMDLYGRRNIKDLNVQLSMQPHKQVQVLLWYHYFRLQNANDVPYNVLLVPYNPGNSPASTDLGQEIDLTVTWNFTPRTSLLLGYSHFFAGEYYKLTPGVPFRNDADFFYTQLTWNF